MDNKRCSRCGRKIEWMSVNIDKEICIYCEDTLLPYKSKNLENKLKELGIDYRVSNQVFETINPRSKTGELTGHSTGHFKRYSQAYECNDLCLMGCYLMEKYGLDPRLRKEIDVYYIHRKINTDKIYEALIVFLNNMKETA